MSTNIKVDRVVFLKALKAKVTKLEKEDKETNEAIVQYKKDEAAYTAELAKLAKKGALVAVSKTDRYNRPVQIPSGSATVALYYTFNAALLPPSPEQPNRSLNTSVLVRLRNAVSLLEMSTQETVNTSTFKDVAEFV